MWDFWWLYDCEVLFKKFVNKVMYVIKYMFSNFEK